jgi:hypothetical protein
MLQRINRSELEFSLNEDERTGLKKGRFTEEQLLGIPKHHYASINMADIHREPAQVVPCAAPARVVVGNHLKEHFKHRCNSTSR